MVPKIPRVEVTTFSSAMKQPLYLQVRRVIRSFMFSVINKLVYENHHQLDRVNPSELPIDDANCKI